MPPYMAEWKKLNLKFDGIVTGFLGSHNQIAIVEEFFKNFKTEDNIVVIDPVMGDYGNLYPTYTDETCQEMKKLVKYADILTPNLTKSNFKLTSESVQGNTVPVTTDAQTEDCPMLEIGEHQYLLTESKTIIGRGSDCDIVIDDPGISRRHMQIDITDNGNTVIARDLGSTNGMYVEGHHVEAATLLDGNTITIGRTRILYWASSQDQE